MLEIKKINLNFFKKKSILITGGTGSLGNALVEKFLKFKVFRKIIIYSRDELKQSLMIKKYSNLDKKDALRFFIGDVRDYDRLNLAFKDVDLVIHAAALKHVDVAEYNPMEFIKTNIDGASNVVKACLENNIQKVIALSTDKAANPINLYGATKLVSDKIFVSANNIAGLNKTRFTVVRYGNVINSRGSVLPFFKNINQTNQNFFPITHSKMTRFFITLDQAVNLIINSFYNSHGGEVIIPKIPSVKIVDIAKAINPEKKIKIIGIRPGEKLHEILCSKDEANLTIEFKDYYILQPAIKYIDGKTNFFINKNGLKGKKVKENFEYNSLNNREYLNKNLLRKIIKKIDQ
jgi:UDP-N-acetylglucosamine 4,6-dehydratase